MDAAAKILQRIEALAAISEEPDQLTRRFATPAMRRANALAGQWMRDAGMTVKQDAIGNLIGHYPGTVPDAKVIMLGSHLDTVPNAGKFDGTLGVVAAIACVEQLAGRALPFAMNVVAFADEEGTRYHTSYLGSGAVAGELDAATLDRPDADGITLASAIREFGGDPDRISSCRAAPEQLLAYAEVHIEQGPVLERKKQAVGVVSAIAGQTRAAISIDGSAGHAGTTPMRGRRDALCAAAEFILDVERRARNVPGLVATVGQIAVEPGAGNVIPATARLTLDIRHSDDNVREAAVKIFRKSFDALAARRRVSGSWTTVGSTPTVPCSARQMALMRKAVRRHQARVVTLPSGAGHDAAMMAKVVPVAMLFVRCKGGLSHHPDESVAEEDIRIALAALCDYVALLAGQL